MWREAQLQGMALLAVCEARAGRFAVAQSLQRQGIELAGNTRLRAMTAQSVANFIWGLGSHSMLMSEWGAAEIAHRMGVSVVEATRRPSPELRVAILCSASELMRRMSRWNEAGAFAGIALQKADGVSKYQRANVLHALGVVWKHDGRVEEALTMQEEALALIRSVPLDKNWLLGCLEIICELVELYQCVGKSLRPLLEQVAVLTPAIEALDGTERGSAFLHMGEMSRRMGQAGEAAEFAAEARECFEKGGMEEGHLWMVEAREILGESVAVANVRG